MAANRKYMGPATTLDGKTVPADGLSVNYSDDVVKTLMAHGHIFADADGVVELQQPTPQEANDGDAAPKARK